MENSIFSSGTTDRCQRFGAVRSDIIWIRRVSSGLNRIPTAKTRNCCGSKRGRAGPSGAHAGCPPPAELKSGRVSNTLHYKRKLDRLPNSDARAPAERDGLPLPQRTWMENSIFISGPTDRCRRFEPLSDRFAPALDTGTKVLGMRDTSPTRPAVKWSSDYGRGKLGHGPAGWKTRATIEL